MDWISATLPRAGGGIASDHRITRTIFVTSRRDADSAVHNMLLPRLLWRLSGVDTSEILLRCQLKHSSMFTSMTFNVRLSTDMTRTHAKIKVKGHLVQTVILIIISFPSPTLSFIPDLKPSFSAKPSHCSLSFSSSGLTTWFPRLLLLLLSISVFLLFSLSVLHFIVVVSVR